MKKTLVIIAALCMSFAGRADSLKELREVRNAYVKVELSDWSVNSKTAENFLKYSDYGNQNNCEIRELYIEVAMPDKERERLVSMFDKSKRQWKDLNYADQSRGSWNTGVHMARVQALSKLYASGGYKSKELHDIVHAALDWWIEEHPINPNWWHNNIGIPRKMASTMLMLQKELSQKEIEGCLAVLDHAKFGMTGQNRVWLAGINIMRGLFMEDEDLVRKAIAEIDDEIKVTTEEGIQEDWSFHQHGPQIQLGNYGLAFADNVSFWMRVFKGTSYQFSKEKIQIIENYVRKGLSWAFWRGVMDHNYRGRQPFYESGPGKAYAFAVVAENLAEALNDSFFRKLAMTNLEPEKYENTLIGSKFFPRSDCGIYRAQDWYASIRMHSERTIGFERTNAENTLSNFSADGALLIMRDGPEYDDIPPIWDWRKIPGTTTYEDGLPLKMDNSREGRQNNSKHVGGLAWDDVMASTMELERDGLHAMKSQFFFPGFVLNLGAGITSSRAEISDVTTALEQNHLKGSVRQGKGWAWHNGNAYVSLDKQPLIVTTDEQEGSWTPISPTYDGPIVKGKVFKCWIDHGALRSGEGKYAYAVIPGGNPSMATSWARSPKVKILSNTADCQAVRYGSTICAVFHRPGSIRVKGKTVSSATPGIVIVKGNASKEYPLDEPVK